MDDPTGANPGPSVDDPIIKRLDFLVAAVERHDKYFVAIGTSVDWLKNTFEMIVQGLMHSPMGGMIRKQMERANNG
jgi:hypothetical protein